jgi:DNA polymerase V
MLFAPTDRFDLLVEAARLGLQQVLLPRQVAARLHVTASKLCWPGSMQLGLFEPPAERAAAIAQLKREVNAKFGRFMLRSGTTLFLCEIYRDRAYSYEICDVREKMCF